MLLLAVLDYRLFHGGEGWVVYTMLPADNAALYNL